MQPFEASVTDRPLILGVGQATMSSNLYLVLIVLSKMREVKRLNDES